MTYDWYVYRSFEFFVNFNVKNIFVKNFPEEFSQMWINMLGLSCPFYIRLIQNSIARIFLSDLLPDTLRRYSNIQMKALLVYLIKENICTRKRHFAQWNEWWDKWYNKTYKICSNVLFKTNLIFSPNINKCYNIDVIYMLL